VFYNTDNLHKHDTKRHTAAACNYNMIAYRNYAKWVACHHADQARQRQ